jgi:HK97 family phage prohead protease
MIKLTASDTFIVAEEGETPRTISGVAVPWNTEATVSDGTRVMFERGSLSENGKKPKLLKYHDDTAPVGIVTSRLDTEKGMLFTARISATTEGNDMLELIKDGAVDAVSVGVNPTDYRFNDDGVMVITAGDWVELSLVTAPAFRGATITEVAATENKSDEQELQPMTDKLASAANVAETPAATPTSALTFAEPRRVPDRLPSAAEYVSAFIQGGDTFRNVNRMIADHQAYHNPISAAAGDETTTNAPGLLPVPILGPVYDNISYLRPVVSAIGARAMPTFGATFIRPEITTHSSVAQQSNQLDTLSSTTMVVSSNTVTKLTFGGTVRVAEQLGDWSDPAFVNIVLQDLANQYADQTDNYAADQLLSGSTSFGTWNGNADSLVADIYSAAKAIAANTNVLPTHLFVDPATWAKIGGLVDSADRPLFPSVGPFNASGTQNASSWNGNPLGLTMVVDKNFTAKNMIVGCAAGQFAGFEIFEQQKGAVSVEKPDILARQISFRGYFATLMLDATKFQAINWV